MNPEQVIATESRKIRDSLKTIQRAVTAMEGESRREQREIVNRCRVLSDESPNVRVGSSVQSRIPDLIREIRRSLEDTSLPKINSDPILRWCDAVSSTVSTVETYLRAYADQKVKNKSARR
jgi:hypothetical protein